MSENQTNSTSSKHSEADQMAPIERHLRVKLEIYPDNESPQEDSNERDSLPSYEDATKPVDDAPISEETIVVPDPVIVVEEKKLNNAKMEEEESMPTSPMHVAVEESEFNSAVNTNDVIQEPVNEPQQQTKDEMIAEKIECIMSELCDEIIESGESGTSCDSCMDCCCWSFNSDSINPCQSCCTCDGETKLKEKMTPVLRKARRKGMSVLRKLAFPLITDIVRRIWVFLELVTVLIGLGLAVARAFLDEINLLSLIATSVGSFFAIMDSIGAFKLVKKCRSCCCSNTNVEDQEVVKNSTCCSFWRDLHDIIRLIVSEMIIYPTLIYSIFNVIIGRTYKGETHLERIGFSLFLLSCISLLLYVYVVRLIAIGGIIKGVWEVRIPRERDRSDDFSAAYSALLYQLYFGLHVFLQMIVQILMIIAIAAKIRYEYRHVYMEEQGTVDPTSTFLIINNNTSTTTSHPSTNADSNSTTSFPNTNFYSSNQLLYMLLSGYFLPPMGFLSFFIVTYYWSQEMPIDLLIAMIKVYKKGSKKDFLEGNDILNEKKALVERTIDTFFERDTLLEEFDALRNVSFVTKFLYPFKSPIPIVFCLAYGLFQGSFVICAAVTYDEMGELVVHILNGGGWVIYFIFACVVGALANLYALLVAAIWVAIIIIVVTLVILTIISYCLEDRRKRVIIID